MTTMTATEARKLLYKLLGDVADSHEPIQITEKRASAVLSAMDGWRAAKNLRPLARSPECVQ